MPQIKLALWNVEWLNELFTGEIPTFHPDNNKGYMTKHLVGDRRRDLNGVINEINADIWVFVEGPNQASELELFFSQDEIDGTWECAVEPSGAQSLGLAVRTDQNKFADVPFNWFSVHTSEEAEILKQATNEFVLDTDDDDIKEVHKFERRPLYASINLKNGNAFRVLALHLKSKGVFGSLEWSKWWAKADGNRKKIVAQCYQLRTQFLNKYLKDEVTKDIPLIVCGDINDGPGFDASEMKIKASGIERLMGSIWKPDLTLGNAVYDTLSDKHKNEMNFSSLYTASFADPILNRVYRRSWIDHILYSCRHKNWVSDAQIMVTLASGNPMYQDFPKASDHFPVTCMINLDHPV